MFFYTSKKLSENGFLGIQNKVSNAYESAVLASMKKASDEKQNGVAGEQHISE